MKEDPYLGTDSVFKLWDTLATKPYRIGLLFTHKNGDFGAISLTERSFAIWCNHPLSHAIAGAHFNQNFC